MNLYTNQPASQPPTKYPTKQLTNQPIHKPTYQLTNQETIQKKTAYRRTNFQPTKQAAYLSTNQPAQIPTNQLTYQLNSQPNNLRTNKASRQGSIIFSIDNSVCKVHLCNALILSKLYIPPPFHLSRDYLVSVFSCTSDSVCVKFL